MCQFLKWLNSTKVKVKSLSRVRPSVTLRTAAFQAPPSMGFSRQDYWSGVPLPSPLNDLVILLPDIYLRGYAHQKTWTRMFTVIWERSKCPSPGESVNSCSVPIHWIITSNKNCHTNNMNKSHGYNIE